MIRRLITNQVRRYFCRESDVLKTVMNSAYTLQQIQIQQIVNQVPSLKSLPIDNWQICHKTFINQGIKTKQFLEIILENPDILLRLPTKISRSFEIWRSCQFGEKCLLELLAKYPSLLDVIDENKLISAVTFLRKFVGTTKNVWRLVMNSPNVIYDKQFDTENKFIYLCDTMRIDITEIVKSQAFKLSLDEIRMRHEFLKRLGLFTPRSLKAHPSDINKNNKLSDILDTTDHKFAITTCGVKLEEYEAFQDLFRKELKKDDLKKDSKEDADEDEHLK